MSTLIGDLNSIQISKSIKWYFYICEWEAPAPAGDWMRAELANLGRDFGVTAMLVVGYDQRPTEQIVTFLTENLEPEIRDKCWRLFSGVTIVATNRPLPNTDAMAVIPLCERNADPNNNPAALKQIKHRLETLIDAIRNGTVDRLLEVDAETLRIQQGHFDVGPINDWGVCFLKKLDRYAPIKIPLWLTTIEVSKFINDLIEKRYPTVSSM